jgi:hypothetical protein
VSGRQAIVLNGIGARLAVYQSVIVTKGEAIFFDPGNTRTKMNISCELTHVTLAAQGPIVRIGPVAGRDIPLEPLIIQSRECAFLAPFAEAQSGVLLCEGEALARGAVIWQGERNLFDRRLRSYVWIADDAPSGSQPFALWTRIWGPANEKMPLINLPLTNALKWDSLQLDRLLLSEIKLPQGTGSANMRPGADLAALGLLPKSSKPIK